MYNTELDNYVGSGMYQKDDNNYSGSIGNPNWLIWLRTVDYSSYNDKLIDSERALFSYLASNRDGMAGSCKTVFDRLWVELRCYLNNEVLRRYIVCRKIVREKLLLAEEQGDIDEDFDSKSPLRIFKSLFKNHTSHLYPSNINELETEIQKCADSDQLGYGRLISALLKRTIFFEKKRYLSDFWPTVKSIWETYEKNYQSESESNIRFQVLRFLVSVSYTLSKQYEQDGEIDYCNPIFFDILEKYLEILHTYRLNNDCILFYLLCNRIDSPRAQELLINFLTSVDDENSMRYFKEQLYAKFPGSECEEIILKAAHRSQFINHSVREDPSHAGIGFSMAGS
jgi:hypothetical protein